MTVKTLGDNVTVNTNDYTGTEDNVMLSGGNANNNFAGSSDTGGGGATFLLRFTGWGSIPAGSTITDVKLTLKCASGGPTNAALTVRRVLRAVSETTSSWNNYSTGNAWGTAGCLGDGTDRDATNICTLTYPGGFLSGAYQSDSTSAFVSWAQAVLDSGTTPWLYVAPAGSEAWSLSAAADGNRPFLTVTFTAGAAGPDIDSTSTATPSNGSSLTITGTAFGASQGSGGVTIGGVTQTVTAWSDTSITVTVVRGTNKYGAAVNVIVTDNSLAASAPFALTSLQPQAGWAFIDLVTPSTTAYNRLATSPDLASGDQIAYESLSGAVTVANDATYTVANTVTSFQFEAWTPASGWGALGVQTTPPPWYAPASADTYELAAKVAEFRAQLDPRTWFGPVVIAKWFADELADTVGTGSFSDSVNESATAAATQTAVAAYFASITEAATAADASTASLATTAGVSESATVNAAQTAQAAFAAAITDASTASESTDATQSSGSTSSVSEGAAADATQTAIAAFAATVSESASANSAQTVTAQFQATISEAASAGSTQDSTLTAGGTGSVTEVASANSTQTGVAAYQATMAEASTLADLIAASHGTFAAILEVAAAISIQDTIDLAPVFSGGNAAIGLGLLAAGSRIGNSRLVAQSGRIG